MTRPPHKTTYTVIGFTFGCGFPLVAFLVDAGAHGLLYSFDSFLFLQRSQPLHWMIDTAPIFLGYIAYFAGLKQDRIQHLAENLQSQLHE